MGRSPEWSNVFGHQEALEEIDMAQKTLRAAASPQRESVAVEEAESCNSCEGTGEIAIKRNRKGEIDYIDGNRTGEVTACRVCHGEGVR
jgi:hypothetical protein